jgi:F-box domain
MNSLPLELIDDIVAHVDEKDDISHFHLLSCSLVCRLWLPSSKRRLFHHIKFMFRPPRRDQLHAQIQRLDPVLPNSPHLTRYIRVVELPDLSSSGHPNHGISAYTSGLCHGAGHESGSYTDSPAPRICLRKYHSPHYCASSPTCRSSKSQACLGVPCQRISDNRFASYWSCPRWRLYISTTLDLCTWASL